MIASQNTTHCISRHNISNPDEITGDIIACGPSMSLMLPSDISSNTQTESLSVKVWIFHNKGSRVCEKCAPLDGKIYLDKASVPKPPLHPNCKCYVEERIIQGDDSSITGDLAALWAKANRNKLHDPAILKTSDEGLSFIKNYEGYEDVRYQDQAKNTTIGYGHKLTADELKRNAYASGISEEEAAELLRKDLETAERYVRETVKVPMRQHEFDALVSYTYNLGGGYLKKESDVPGYFNKERFQEAADALRLARRAGGKRSSGLIKRRNDERRMMLDGTYERTEDMTTLEDDSENPVYKIYLKP